MEEARCDGFLGELDDGLIELALFLPYAGSPEAEGELQDPMLVHAMIAFRCGDERRTAGIEFPSFNLKAGTLSAMMLAQLDLEIGYAGGGN